MHTRNMWILCIKNITRCEFENSLYRIGYVKIACIIVLIILLIIIKSMINYVFVQGNLHTMRYQIKNVNDPSHTTMIKKRSTGQTVPPCRAMTYIQQTRTHPYYANAPPRGSITAKFTFTFK